MAKFERQYAGDSGAILSKIESAADALGISVELVDVSSCRLGEIQVVTQVYEKYFMRNGSYASLTITTVSNGERVCLSAIGAAGGTGWANISWGAETSLMKRFEQNLEEQGL